MANVVSDAVFAPLRKKNWVVGAMATALVCAGTVACSATISPTQGLAVNLNAGAGFDGLQINQTIAFPGIQPNQLRYTVYAGENLTGGIIGTRVAPDDGFGSGVLFVVAPDADGIVSVLATAEFGEFDLEFNGFGRLTCSANDFRTCSRADGIAFDESDVFVAPIPLPSALPMLGVAMLGFLALVRRKIRVTGRTAPLHDTRTLASPI